MSKITVKISEDDALDFLIRNYDETKKQKVRKNKSRILMSLFFLVFSIHFYFTGYQSKAIIFLALSVGWFFILPYYLRSTVIRTYKNHVKNDMGGILNKPITYELIEKGIFVKYELEEATYYYEILEGVSRVGRNVYIKHQGKVPIIIPYNNNIEAIDNFIASLEERLRKHRENKTNREQSVSD